MPPLRRTYQAPIGAALPRRYARSSLRFASLGIRDARAPSTRHRFRPLAARCATRDTAPAPATAPPLTRLGAACARGWATSPAVIPTHFVVGIHGWARVELAHLRSLASASAKGLGNRSAGFTTLPAWFFAAISRALVLPTTKRVGRLRVGARAEMRYAAARREPNPASDPRSSRHLSWSGLAYARRSNPPRTAVFQRRLSVRASAFGPGVAPLALRGKISQSSEIFLTAPG